MTEMSVLIRSSTVLLAVVTAFVLRETAGKTAFMMAIAEITPAIVSSIVVIALSIGVLHGLRRSVQAEREDTSGPVATEMGLGPGRMSITN